MWDIIKQISDNNRRELTLTGTEIDGKCDEIENDTSGLFSLIDLNLLRISKSSLASIPNDIQNLVNLTNLVCQNNLLETFPSSIGKLSKLTLLDLSGNKLKELPNELNNLPLLASLNVSCNQLKSIPCLSECKSLASINASYNQITEFINVSEGLQLLADVNLSDNKIESIPPAVGLLSSFKKLELENNLITDVPGNLIDCLKFKVLMLNGNELKDRRMRKLVENPRTQPDQVIKYIRQHCAKQKIIAPPPPPQANGAEQESEESQEVTKEATAALSFVTLNPPTIDVSHPDPLLYVTVTSQALALRPHLVCCVVNGVDLQEERFKKFLVAQNKLHEGVCNKRLQSTIATHDLGRITFSVPATEESQGSEGLVYTSKPKGQLVFLPLNCRSKPMSAAKFLATLQVEANNQRKLQKSNNVSGLYKYLQLVTGWQSFPCLLDAQQAVLSVPPLTNSDHSKMTPDTTTLLLEVSSDKSLAVCKATMTELLQAVLAITPSRTVNVQQVRVQAEDGGLRCQFPATDDLTQLPGVTVNRPGKK